MTTFVPVGGGPVEEVVKIGMVGPAVGGFIDHHDIALIRTPMPLVCKQSDVTRLDL
jgi:hypothetical protein